MGDPGTAYQLKLRKQFELGADAALLERLLAAWAVYVQAACAFCELASKSKYNKDSIIFAAVLFQVPPGLYANCGFGAWEVSHYPPSWYAPDGP